MPKFAHIYVHAASVKRIFAYIAQQILKNTVQEFSICAHQCIVRPDILFYFQFLFSQTVTHLRKRLIYQRRDIYILYLARNVAARCLAASKSSSVNVLSRSVFSLTIAR